MGFFISPETYQRDIWSIAPPDEKKGTPGKGEKGTVTLRRLNAGDQAAIQDLMRMSIGEGDAAPSIGTMRMLTVQRAVVDWDFPGPKPSQESISQLEPEVFDQIYGYCEIGTPPTEPPSENGKAPEAEAAPTDEAETPTPASAS